MKKRNYKKKLADMNFALARVWHAAFEEGFDTGYDTAMTNFEADERFKESNDDAFKSGFAAGKNEQKVEDEGLIVLSHRDLVLAVNGGAIE